ncbi:MAG: ABC transporter ATP-binding protein [Clostridia bacterium]
MGIYKRYFFRYKGPFLLSIGCVVLEALCDLMGPTFMARMIDEGIAPGQMRGVLTWGGRMLLFTAIGAVFAVARNILSSHVSQRIGADLRHDLFEKILNFSEAGADALPGGSLITRMTNDTTQVTQFVNGLMRIFLKAPITCVGSIVLASLLNFRLSLVIYGVVVVVTGLIVLSMKLSYPRFARLQRAMDRMNAVVQEYLLGVRLVKAFGTCDTEVKRFGQANAELMARSVSTQIVITLIAPLMSLVVGLGSALIILAGSALFAQGLVMPGNVSAFTIYMAQILSSLLMITNIFHTFVRTKASTARIKEVLNAPADFPHAGGDARLAGDVVFDGVTFAYPSGSGVPVIKNLSFSASAGKSLAIIGPTGSGKSTICALLLRFYDVQNGRVVVDGVDVRDMDVDVLRKNMAVVPQNPMLFSGTVDGNIRCGNTAASPAQVASAARQAQADFIEKMPLGFESVLGSAGVNLSGGQKQRLSIARGLLRDAPILLLDDATSALDAITEARVREMLKRFSKDHTVIAVTQRLTTAMAFDKILVIEDGVRVGYGGHEALLETCDTYRDIYFSQVDGRGGDLDE